MSERSVFHRLGRRVIVFAVTMTGITLWMGCGGSAPPPVTEVHEVRQVRQSDGGPPSWLSDPTRHPDYPPDRYLCAVGSSKKSERAAERAAYRQLADRLDAEAEAMLRRLVDADRAWQRDDSFQLALDRAMSRGRQLSVTWMELSRSGPYQRRGSWHAIACLNREEMRDRLTRRAAAVAQQAHDAETGALVAAEEDDWFEFARQVRTIRTSEAEHLAVVARQHALQGSEHPIAPRPRSGSTPMKAALDSLRKWTGWTLRTDFSWEGKPPPPSFQPRLKDRLMRGLLEEGFRIGFGTGCPKHVRPDEDEEPIETGSHYVLRIRVNGTSSRTAIASWDIEYDLAMDVRQCDGGVEIPSRFFGRISATHDRDPGTAYLMSLNNGELDSLVTHAFREIDLILPGEITE